MAASEKCNMCAHLLVKGGTERENRGERGDGEREGGVEGRREGGREGGREVGREGGETEREGGINKKDGGKQS